MEPIQFRQMIRSSFLQERPKSFSVVGNGYYQALTSTTSEIIIVELLGGPKFNEKMLFSPTYISVPKERFTEELFTDGPVFSDMYTKCTVEQSQELVLDPIYVGTYCNEPLLPGNVEIAFAPMEKGDSRCILGVLTSFGVLDIYGKRKLERSWQKLMPSFNKLFQTVVFPRATPYTPNTKFEELKAVVNTYWVTAFAWHDNVEQRIIFTANARGDLVVFELNESRTESTLRCRTETTLGRITLLKCFGNGLLLVANVFGVVHMYRLVTENGDMQLVHSDVLIAKPDRMTLSTACHIEAHDNDGYLLFYAKGAHIILHHMSSEGKNLNKLTKYLGGLKITAINVWSKSSFLVVNTVGVLRRVHVYFRDGKLMMHVQAILADFESLSSTPNYEVVGAAGSANSNLWSVMYSRVRDADPKKVQTDHCILVMYRIQGFDIIDRLLDWDYSCLDPFNDYAVELKMNVIQNNMSVDMISAVRNGAAPDYDDPDLLKCLQLQHMATQFMLIAQQHDKLVLCEKKRDFEFAFLKISHIFARLQYLKELQSRSLTVKLTEFQRSCASCMSVEFFATIDDLRRLEEFDFGVKIPPFITATLKNWTSKGFPDFRWDEKCAVCMLTTDPTTRVCANGHVVKRCAISFRQLALFNEVSCKHCDARFHGNQAELQSLYGGDRLLACVQCAYAIQFDASLLMAPAEDIPMEM